MSRVLTKDEQGIICDGCCRSIEDFMIEKMVLYRKYKWKNEEGKYYLKIGERPKEIPNYKFWRARLLKFHNEECVKKRCEMFNKVCGDNDGLCYSKKKGTKCYLVVICRFINLVIYLERDLDYQQKNIERLKRLGLYIEPEDKRYCKKCGYMMHKDFIKEHEAKCKK